MKDRSEALAEDRRLVLLAQGGDPAAFGALVRKYTGVVRALVAARVGWGPDADDAVQDVFLLAFRRLESLAEPGRFAGWISRIAVNRGLEVLRRAAPRRAASLDRLPVEPAATQGADPLERDDEVSAMLRAVTTLDEKTQMILALRFREELAVKDIAARLGEQPPAISMRITRALRKLRSELGEDAL